MKQLTQLALVFAFVLGASFNAKAALLIEPVIGYNLNSKLEMKFDDAIAAAAMNDNLSGGRGAAYGGRLGYQQLGFQLGLDYLNSTISGGDFDDDMKINEWAGFIGYEFPILFRVYAGYIFSGTGKTKINGDSSTLKKESGTKLGVGFTGLPFIDINLEYRRATWTEFSSGGTDYDGKFSYSTIMLGLSVPFTI